MIDEVNLRAHSEAVFKSLGLSDAKELDPAVSFNYDCMRALNAATQTYCRISSEYALQFQGAVAAFCASASEEER